MSSQSSGVPMMDKGDLHPEALHQQSQPIDLAAHRGPAVVQIRPVRSISSLPHGTLAAKTASAGVVGSGPSAFNLTRTASSGPNLTIMPARGTTQPGVNSPSLPTYIAARGTIIGGVRPTGHQPASITVTPISTSNFQSAIRLPPPGNNGAWATLQQSNPAQGPIRATTITVNRTVRSETKMIHIGNPQNANVQHAQLALVDTKGSVLKPQITTTPLMNVRGSGNNTTSLTLPIAPFTIRAANLTTLQQRPLSGSGNNATQPKVITQPAHGPPIQLVSTQKLPIHAISQTIPRLNTVCLTLSTHAPLNSSNTAPVVAMASRQGAGSSLVMTSSAVGAQSSSSAVPITKVYPVNRDSGQVVETIIASQSPVSASGVNVSSYSNPAQGVVIASSSAANSHLVAQSIGGNLHSNHLVQVHGLSGSGNSNSNQSLGNNGSGSAGYYHVEPKNLNVNLVQTPLHNRPVTIEKRTVTSGNDNAKGLLPGSTVILTTQNQQIPVAHSSFPHSISSTHGVFSQHNTIIQSHQVIHSGSPNSVSVSQAATAQSVGGHHILPAHILSQQSGIPSASISVTPITASTSTSQGGTSTSTFQSSSISVSVTSANSSSVAASTSSSTTTMQASNPAQSPSQTQAKSTLSPRPSILRKRDAGDHNHHILPSRAQRNLALNFTVTNQNVHLASASAAAAAAAAANKENSNGSTTTTINLGAIPSQITVTPSSGSVSLLKKEFQPPNEESSWQSCSSNSSGSTTISTTSETAELQIQQSTASVGPEGLSISSLPLGLSLPGISISSTSFERTQSFASVHSNAQNGIMKSTTSSTGRGKGGKSGARDGERLKARQDKEEGVSPRKKPRKQQLTTSVFESASPEISFYQGKKPKKADADVEEKPGDVAKEDQEDQKIVYYLKKPHMSLLQTNKYTSKPPHNHFQRYCDVKSKDERRPTVNDLLNQKNVVQKCNGWKLQHLNDQVEEIIELEGDVVDRFSVLLEKLEAKIGSSGGDKDLSRIQELLKGNIQRGKVIRDQMLESKSQVLKILEHKPRVLDVISRYNTKRPLKKRERV